MDRSREDPDHTNPDSAYIVATGPEHRVRRTIKYDDTFLVVDAHGDIGTASGSSDGLYHNDTRFLSRLELRINGLQPLLLGSNMREDNAVFIADLTNPDMFRQDPGSHERVLMLEKDTVHINRANFLWHDDFYQRISLRNHSSERVELKIAIAFAGDFADLFEVRGMSRPRRGTCTIRINGSQEVVLRYVGLDGVTRTTSVYFDPPPTTLTEREAVYLAALTSKETMSVRFSARCNPSTPKPVSFARGLLHAHRELRQAAQGAAVVDTSNPVFDSMLRRSMADLAMLKTETPQGPFPCAGTPWYATTFGRDGLITALEMLWVDPKLARGVLLRLAALQATTTDPASDAEPGKILHEMRMGEMAQLGEIPFSLYYGSVDSTPLFVLLAGLYHERTGDDQTLKDLWPAIEKALAWIAAADGDGDGFIEYQRAEESGLANQGWKDSHDAIFHADGQLADGPIALCEVQGYVYAAKMLIARCARRLGNSSRAEALETEARALAERFEQAFWCDDLHMYAVALDGAKRPCRVRTSNAGQVLFSGIAKREHADIVARRLLEPDMFSGWGIRTVSRSETRYNPMSYHNGSVWPHDNALIAVGLARLGAKDAVNEIFGGLFDAATYMDLHRLPELFCGFQRPRNRGPTRYPVACAPQAWASATPFCLLRAALGIETDPARKELRLRRPTLPRFLNEVTVRDLHVGGDAKVDFTVRRDGSGVSVSVLQTRGDVEVSVVAP